MHILYRRQWLLLGLAFCSIGIFFAHRAWQLRYLYLDQQVREEIQQSLQDLSADEGWLLSDLSVVEANCDYQIKVLHREHKKGRDTTECFYLDLRDSSRTACSAYL